MSIEEGLSQRNVKALTDFLERRTTSEFKDVVEAIDAGDLQRLIDELKLLKARWGEEEFTRKMEEKPAVVYVHARTLQERQISQRIYQLTERLMVNLAGVLVPVEKGKTIPKLDEVKKLLEGHGIDCGNISGKCERNLCAIQGNIFEEIDVRGEEHFRACFLDILPFEKQGRFPRLWAYGARARKFFGSLFHS